MPSPLTESNVIRAVCVFLKDHGYAIEQRKSTKERGIDIIATHHGIRLLIEAKGATSSQPHTKRYGKPFTWNQSKSHVGSLLFQIAKRYEQADDSVRFAMALPATPDNLKIVRQMIKRTLDALGIGVFLVDAGGRVMFEGPWETAQSTPPQA